MSRRIRQPTPIQAYKRIVRQTELEDPAGATAQTRQKLRRSPIDWLVSTNRIGPIELAAAHDISVAFEALTRQVGFKPLSMERVDRSHEADDPARVIDAIGRYHSWANHWSMRRKRGDKTLEIAIAAIIDERSFDAMDSDLSLRHGKARRITEMALRDYAARARWVGGRLRVKWIVEASNGFRLLPLDIAGKK